MYFLIVKMYLFYYINVLKQSLKQQRCISNRGKNILKQSIEVNKHLSVRTQAWPIG
jgi:hypothetical protein